MHLLKIVFMMIIVKTYNRNNNNNYNIIKSYLRKTPLIILKKVIHPKQIFTIKQKGNYTIK